MINLKTVLSTILLLIASLALPAQLMADTLPKALQEGLKELAATKGFACSFSQTITFSDDEKQHFSGELEIARPGMFRWQYLKPYQQLFISNGNGVWLYEPDLMQAQWLDGLEAVDPVAMRLLNGQVRNDEVHLLGISEDKKTYHLRIGATQELWLTLSDGMPRWIESRDPLGNSNRITLTQIKKQQPDKARFHFDVPEGVDVINTGVSAVGGTE